MHDKQFGRGRWLARLGAWLRRPRSPGRRRSESEQGHDRRQERTLPPGIDPEALAVWKAKSPGWDRPVWIEDLGTGAYDIRCLSCRHDFRFAGLLHGFGARSSLTLGYTCERCHRLTEISWNRANPQQDHPACTCGGSLAREGLMHCPKCGSPDLTCYYLPAMVT